MIPRLLSAILIAVFVPLASVAADKTKSDKKAAPKSGKPYMTWKSLAEYVAKNGSDRPIRAPLARNLGFGVDEVATKAMRLKRNASPDGREHAIHVVVADEKSKIGTPKEIILVNTIVVGGNGKKYLEATNFRADAAGRLVSVVNSKGYVGSVEQSVVDPSSDEVKRQYESERSFCLNKIDALHLSK